MHALAQLVVGKDRDDLAAGIAFNAGLEMGYIEDKRGEQGLDDICSAKSEEAVLVSDGDEVSRVGIENEI